MFTLSSAAHPWSRHRAALALVTLGLVCGAVGLATLSEGYIDFGDGNYLYIAWRLSEGAVLYQDILSPQPPLHLHVGAALVGLGEYPAEPIPGPNVVLVGSNSS